MDIDIEKWEDVTKTRFTPRAEERRNEGLPPGEKSARQKENDKVTSG